ncbi:MAG: BspA family leucine-rich repeat surface protein, partial [Erysipelotrichaceae bacterium]|nr:BspA family leucine-rich repeat surface protein [Erysipelotrichaceae bacterium]
MKHKKVAKIGIVFALVISIVMNSAGNLFAQQEQQIEEVTTEDYESEIEAKEEIKEEGIAERERPSELEDSSIDKQEESSDQEEESAMYTLSKNKFRDIHVTYPDYPNGIPFFDTVKFTDEPLPAGVTSVDLSENGDGSVIGGVEGEGTNQSKLIVTTNTPGEKVKFPRDSSYLFVSFFFNDPSNGIAPLERNVIDLSKVDTSEVTDMQGMFAGVEISRLDLSSFDTRNVKDMSRMFEKCRKLTEVDLSSFYTYFVMDMSYMFAECSSLTNLDINHFNIAYVTWMDGMFQNCTSIVDIDISNFSSSHLLGISAMFSGCSSLKNLDITNFRTSGVLYMERLFEGCRSLTNLDLSTLDTKAVKNMYRMFAECTSLRELDLTNFNTENVMNMDSMFKDSTSLINLNLTNFNTQNVRKMNHMFYGCTSLERVDVTNFNTENVQTMWSMFGDCRSLTTLDVSNFNTQNVEYMNYMFYNTSLEELNLSNFNTSKVINMEGMFQGNNALTQLNLSNFDTSKVINMKYMFQNCSSLVILDLTNFSTPQVTNMMEMFNGCSSLTTIYSEEWDTSQVTSDTNMFLGCENVVGKSEYAITTPFDPNRIGKEVATPNNGYFTVPNLEEWNATVKYVDEDNQVLATKGFLTTNRKPEITTEKLNEFMPNGYELVDENSSFTVTQDGQVFEVEVRKVQWTLELEYQTVDGDVVKTEAIQVTQLNPVVTAQTIIEKVPAGYELVDAAADWTATVNGDKKIIQVREVEWEVNLEYQTADGNVVKTEAIQVTQLNPVVTAQTITEKVPTGYELVDPATDWTATANGDKKVIQVREIEWEVSLEYQTEDGTVIKEEQIQVMQLNPVVSAQTITEKVPTGYELVDPANDWTATANGDKKVIQVREVEWTVNLEYQTVDGTVVKTEAIQVTQLNPMVTAQTITEKVPTGYELVDPASDWTANSNGEKKIVQVREVEWTVNLEYQTTDGTVVKTEAIQVTQLNPVVTAQVITEKVPAGYELVDVAADWTATANGDKKIIQVCEVEWEVNLEYQIADG